MTRAARGRTVTGLQRVALVASAEHPETEYEVATNGSILSCNCMGWMRRTHYGDCRAVVAGESCNCAEVERRTGVAGERNHRTCRHVREVGQRIEALGGLSTVLRLMRRGIDVQFEAPAAMHVPALGRAEACDLACAQKLQDEYAGGMRPGTCRHGRRTFVEVVQSVIDARPAARPHVGQRQPGDLGWLGGGRAILLRD